MRLPLTYYHGNYCKVLGRVMLGYTSTDQAEMVEAITNAISLYDDRSNIHKGLVKAEDFLQGLWAEGYFD